MFVYAFFVDDKSMLQNILIFAINSLLLESVKNNVNETSLVRLLQEHKLDCSTDNFKLFIKFIHSIWSKVHHNMSHLELDPLPKFRGMEWSQLVDIKSSSMDSIKERSYFLDLYVDDRRENSTTNGTAAFSMTLSPKELQDFETTLRDCAKSLEKFVSK